MIVKSTFDQKVWSLMDSSMVAEADATLCTVYGNLHRYQVEDDLFFGLNGEVFLRLSYYTLEGQDKKSAPISIHTEVFNVLNSDDNSKYVRLMNEILRDKGAILSVFDYAFEKASALYRVVRWEEVITPKKKEEGIEPVKVVRPSNRKHGQKRPDTKAKKRS